MNAIQFNRNNRATCFKCVLCGESIYCDGTISPKDGGFVHVGCKSVAEKIRNYDIRRFDELFQDHLTRKKLGETLLFEP